MRTVTSVVFLRQLTPGGMAGAAEEREMKRVPAARIVESNSIAIPVDCSRLACLFEGRTMPKERGEVPEETGLDGQQKRSGGNVR